MRTIIQSQLGECGLACLAMVSSALGREIDYSSLRDRHSITSRGMTLAALLSTAKDLGLSARAVRIELEDLPRLRRPAILHWDMQHFVVLAAKSSFKLRWPMRRNGHDEVHIVDPVKGRCVWV